MTSILKIQYKKIDTYSRLLNSKKVKPIINILQLFYNTFNYENENTSVVSWLDNQIIYFLDPYGFDEKYQNNRTKLLEQLDDKFSNCNYKNVSLDKIILELFSWTINELKAFYKINKQNSENKEISVYNLKLRTLNKKGGGLSNNYVLYYIKSLSNKKNFVKTQLFFNNLSSLHKSYPDYNFLENNLNVKEFYINNDTPYVSIEKLFLYLLNISLVKIDKLNAEFNKFFIKFKIDTKIYSSKQKILPINDKTWICINNSSKYGNSYLFYKIIKNRLQKVIVDFTLKTNYLISIRFVSYKTDKKDSDTNYYFYFSNIDKKNNKYFYISKNDNKKEEKNLLLTSSKNFFSEFKITI
jgi:hypothetical protein